MMLPNEIINPPVFLDSLAFPEKKELNTKVDHFILWLLLLSIFLLQACTTVPIPKDTSIAVDGFWEQDENTDPRFYNGSMGATEKIGVLYTVGNNVIYNNSTAVNSTKIDNNANIQTGPRSSARIEFKSAGGKCVVQIQDFKIGKGYGNTQNCQHQIGTLHADGQTILSVYHIEVAPQQTEITVLSGSVQLGLHSNPAKVVSVSSGQEAVLTANSITGPRIVPLQEIKRRVQWRENYQFLDRQVDWGTVGKVAAVAVAVGVGVGVGLNNDDDTPPSPPGFTPQRTSPLTNPVSPNGP